VRLLRGIWVTAGIGSALAARALIRRSRWLDLRGKTVLITGGSRGLGLVLAREFGRQHARVAFCARDQDELERAHTDLESRGIDCVALPCDLAVPEQVRAMVRRVGEAWGGLDVLVNNAGIIQVGPMESMTIEDYERAMVVNFWAAVHATLAAVPLMRRRDRARIVNIASIGGKLSVPHLLPYSVSKFALVGFSEGLRGALRSQGILVTTVCPGLMRTGSPRNATFKGQHRAEYAWFSVSDALPLLSMDVERAARRIVQACQAGQAELILSLPAKMAAAVHGLLPGLTVKILALTHALLPGPGGIGTAGARGSDSTSAVSPSWLTALGDEAAQRHNQVPGPAAADHEVDAPFR
jgi:NAD(P)-dependent dehydrogenase (short-subunit alcohol dehydrogenase family)